ncbi:hypothetical protein P3T76_016034 [Phytophthora citrophthora]|uniref:Cadherin domain-containing protein n=1 Tax=Phytophthora citrophthora TaxID=4793 RepID=A0AAD9FYA3_9STRA|nr:hypothetical protein P3T76_016034 [Phytophthora citrophthora]
MERIQNYLFLWGGRMKIAKWLLVGACVVVSSGDTATLLQFATGDEALKDSISKDLVTLDDDLTFWDTEQPLVDPDDRIVSDVELENLELRIPIPSYQQHNSAELKMAVSGQPNPFEMLNLQADLRDTSLNGQLVRVSSPPGQQFTPMTTKQSSSTLSGYFETPQLESEWAFREEEATEAKSVEVQMPSISIPLALENPYSYMYHSVLKVECLPLVCDEDTPMALDGFSVKATDTTQWQGWIDDLLVIRISVSRGIISLGGSWRSNCTNQYMGAQSRKLISFKASVSCVNKVLTGMEYVGEPNFSGTDELKVRVGYAQDLGATFNEVTVPITVTELNDAPYLDIRSVFYEAEEDIPLVIDDLRLQDPDALDKPLRVTMEAAHGQLALLRPSGVTLTSEIVNTAGEEASKLTLTGTLRNLNAAVASVVYTSAKDWNSLQFRHDDGMNGFDTITIKSIDFSSFNGSSMSTLFVYVDPRPDSVLINAPSNGEASVYVDDTPGTLRGDEDTADNTYQAILTVSLVVSHGILHLSRVQGLTFIEATADRGSILKFKGTFTNVNSCVAGLRYLPGQDFYGLDSLVVTADAVDEYTQQQTPLASIRVAITVDAVNDAPVWNVGSSVIRELQQGRAASLAGISFLDVDVPGINCVVESCVMDLIVETSSGSVGFPDSTVQFSTGMKTASYKVFSGTLDELNEILSEITFELANPDYYRADTPSHFGINVQLTVDDRGTFGSGGPLIRTTTVVFSPVVWSPYTLQIIAPEDVLTLDEDTAFGFNGELQLADPDSDRSFLNLLEMSITCTHGRFTLRKGVTGIQVLSNESDSNIVVKGFFAQLNMALNGSSYIPEENWHGTEELTLSVNSVDRPTETAEASIFLYIAPVCDEPRWVTLTDDPSTMQEDGYLLINTLSLTNPDSVDVESEVEVAIGVNHGGIMLSMTRGLLIQQAEYSTSDDTLVAQHAPPGQLFSESRLFFKNLSFQGRVKDINAALNGMIYKPWLDYNSDGWPVDEIDLVATSVCAINSKLMPSHCTIPIAVRAVNDPAVLISQHFQPVVSPFSLVSLEVASWNSSIDAIEDSSLQLEPTQLYDPDVILHSDDLRLVVNISCIHCTITCQSQTQNAFEAQQNDDLIIVTRNWNSNDGVQLVMHGNLPSLNNGLMNQLIFRGGDSFNGLAFVLVEISDLGNYGEGGELHSTFVLGVKVKPMNDIPKIYLPQYQTVEPVLHLDEGASVLIQGAKTLSAIRAPARHQSPEWNLMIADLLAHDSSSRLRNIHPFSGPSGLVASFVVAHNGKFIFSGRGDDFGQELWCSSGTEVSTGLLKDIFPGIGSSRPSHLTPFSKDNRVYFSAEGPHLSWMIKSSYRDTCQSFRPSSIDPNVFFTVAAQNVWDPKETYDCPLGFRWMSTPEAHRVFVGTIATESSEEPLTYFDQCGWHEYNWGGQTRMYFRFSDSKTTGAFKHAGFRDSYRIDTGFQTDGFAGIVCYREPLGYQITWGTQLWATDGTSEGTDRVARISTEPEGSNPSHFVELAQRLYFQATSTEFGSELWSSDGTRPGTYLVADIEFGSRSSEPQFLTSFNSRMYFSAHTQEYGRELWFSDGNPRFEFAEDQHGVVGTGLLLDICAGEKSSSPQHFAVLNPATGNPLLLYQADDCVHGSELWSTDGTKEGTVIVLDIYEGPLGSRPAYLISFSGQVYFQADDGIHGCELWTTDGTAAGTKILLDIMPGVLGSRPSFFTILDNLNDPSGTLVFSAQSGRDQQTEFWQSDGTSTGTTTLFPQSRQVVELNTESLNLQLVGHSFVSLSSLPQVFFYLGRESDQGVDIQRQATDQGDWTYIEDVARSITLQDVESLESTRELTVSLNCSKGWLSLGRQCDGVSVRLDASPDNKKAATLTLKGSLDALNCAVEKVTYHAKPQENGWDEIHVNLAQSNQATSDTTERDSSFMVSKRMLVEIQAVNDPPVIRMPSIFYAPIDEWISISGIEIIDPDSAEGILYVSLTVHHGLLRVTLPPQGNDGGPTALRTTVNGEIPGILEFATTVGRAKEIFNALQYICDDANGCSSLQSDYLTIQVDDNGFTGAHGPQVASKTSEVIVLSQISVSA